MSTFFDVEPNSWQELETLVHQAFEEMGYEAQRDCELETVRGRVRVDIHAVKTSTPIPTVIVCECKHWKKAVDQNVVYALRSVCSDVGAHFGLLISKIGFQSGAIETRASTNVHLLNFHEFQKTYFSEWKTGIFMRLSALSDALSPLIYNRHTEKNKELEQRLTGINPFKKYEVFFGEHRYTDFFIDNKQFPITITDPRGDPRALRLIVVNSHREYLALCLDGAADARKFFGI